LSINATPLLNNKSEFDGMVATITDITEKKLSDKIFQQKHEELINALESMSDGFVAFDNQLNYTYANKHAEEMFGRKPEDLIGKNYWIEYPEAKGTPFADAYLKALENQQPIIFEDYYTPWQRWFENRIYPSEKGLSIFFQDITTRKLAEEEDKKKQRELEILNSIILKTSESIDLNSRLQYIMDEALNIVGLEGGTICLINPDETFDLAVHRETSKETIDDLSQHKIKIGECLCGNCAKDCKPLILNTREDVMHFATREILRGEDIRFHAAFPFVIENKCIGVLCVFTRTDNKPNARDLKFLGTIITQTAILIHNTSLYNKIIESEEKFRKAFQASPDSITISSLSNGKILEVNEGYLKIFGFTREESIGKTSVELGIIHSEKVRENIFSLMKTGTVARNIEFEFQTKTKEIRTGEISLEKIQFQNEECLIATMRDITDRKHIEDTLRISERYNRTLFNQSVIGLALTKMDGKLVDVNPVFAKIIGRTTEETLNLSYWDITPEKYSDQEQKQLEALNSTGRYGPFEKEYIHKDGHLVPVLLQGLIIEQNNEKFIWSSVEDITERKLAEKALGESEERLRLSTELANVAVWEYDFKTNNMSRSKNHDKLYGLDWQKNWDINNFLNATHPNDREFSNNEIQKSVTPGGNDSYQFDFRVIYPDKSIHWLNVVGQVVERNSKGEGIIVRGCLTDITERKQTEEELKASEIKYRTFFENSMDAILLTEPSGNINSANPAACEMFDRTEEEIIKVGRSGIVDVNDPRLPILLAERTEKRKIRGELNMLRKNGSKFPAELSTALFVDSEGKVRTSMIIRDITARKETEEKLRVSEDKFHSAFHTSPVGITVNRISDGKFIEVNNSFLKMFEFNRDEVIDHTSLELNMLNEDERKKLIKWQIETGGLQNFELTFQTKFGKPIHTIF
ncbi:MAG: PAS domain S-box protein, partial [Melioribacter sp.]|nr:PAS domain S-box protein [Melioribacter sp.]